MDLRIQRFSGVLLGLGLAVCVVCAPVAAQAAQPKGAGSLRVTPLADDLGPREPSAGIPVAGSDPMDPGAQGRAQGAPAALPGGTAAAAGMQEKRFTDGTVLAYLLELARKQNRPCPSGATLPSPPSLIFSEPLCRVAEATARGWDMQAAMAEHGLYAARWRAFSAADPLAQRVAASLRENHCEALLEPHTHIGAVLGPGGWNVIMAVLTDAPPDAELAVPSPAVGGQVSGAATDAFPPAGAPGVPAAAAERKATPPVLLPGEAEASGMAGPAGPDKAPGVTGQEARALFIRINNLREKGGACPGTTARTAPPLIFDPALQVAAEKDATAIAASGSFGVSPGSISGMASYTGTQVAKLMAKTSAPAAVVVDTWMLNPNNCTALLSPMFSDIGVAHADGNWVVILGAKGKGVPSPEPPAR